MAAGDFVQVFLHPKALRWAAFFALAVLALYSVYLSRSKVSNLILYPGENKAATIAKVSMLYGNNDSYLNEFAGCVAVHERHALRHGYPMFVLRNPVAEGYWNKPTYLISLLVQELGKEPQDRLKWLMWVDADSFLINQALPVDIFLPPEDFEDINLLVTRDNDRLNSGIFFVRVHEMSVRLLTKSLAYPMFNPEEELGWSADQWTMDMTINDTEFRHHVLGQPRIWYNMNLFDEDRPPGTLLIHFPGLLDRQWHMQWWLNRTDTEEGAEWEVDLADTEYADRIREFWLANRECRQMVQVADEFLNKTESISQKLNASIEWLKEVCWFSTDQYEKMNLAVLDVKAALEAEAAPSATDEWVNPEEGVGEGGLETLDTRD